MLRRILISAAIALTISAQAQQNDAKMNVFITNLMSKMTLDEKIGQLNLPTPGGGIATGAVVNSDVESKIKAGKVGGMFGVIGVDKIKQVQEMAMTQTRLKIPMFFGSDVIHGYKTTFPIPLGLSCSWEQVAAYTLAFLVVFAVLTAVIILASDVGLPNPKGTHVHILHSFLK